MFLYYGCILTSLVRLFVEQIQYNLMLCILELICNFTEIHCENEFKIVVVLFCVYLHDINAFFSPSGFALC